MQILGVEVGVEIRTRVGVGVGTGDGPKVYVFTQANGDKEAMRITRIRRSFFIPALYSTRFNYTPSNKDSFVHSGSPYWTTTSSLGTGRKDYRLRGLCPFGDYLAGGK
jgi:hypothetical protein